MWALNISVYAIGHFLSNNSTIKIYKNILTDTSLYDTISISADNIMKREAIPLHTAMLYRDVTIKENRLFDSGEIN